MKPTVHAGEPPFQGTFDEVAGHYIEDVKQRYLKVGKLPPTFIFIGHESTMEVVTPWTCDEDRQMVAYTLRRLLEMSTFCNAYVFASEAWMVEHRGSGLPTKRPSEHPDKKEMLLIDVWARDGQYKGGYYEIKRLGWSIVLESLPIGGRKPEGGLMSNLFAPVKWLDYGSRRENC